MATRSNPSPADTSIRCEQFMIGLGSFTPPHEVAELSRLLVGIADRHDRIVDRLRELMTARGIVDHGLDGAAGALDWVPRDLSGFPSSIDSLVAELATRRGDLHTTERRLQAAYVRLGFEPDEPQSAGDLEFPDLHEMVSPSPGAFRFLGQDSEEPDQRSEPSGLDTAASAFQEKIQFAQLAQDTLPHRKLFGDIQRLGQDLERLPEAADHAHRGIRRFLKSLDLQVQNLSMGFNPDDGLPWQQIEYVTPDGESRRGAAPHVLGLLDDRDPLTPTMGRDVPVTARDASLLAVDDDYDRWAGQQGFPTSQESHAQRAALSEEIGAGNHEIAHARAAAGLDIRHPIGNRIVIAQLSRVPTAQRRTGYTSGTAILVRALHSRQIRAYLFADGDSGFLDISATGVAQRIFQRLGSVPLLDEIPEGTAATKVTPSSRQYAAAGKAAIAEELTRAYADGEITGSPTIKTRKEGLGRKLLAAGRKAADDAAERGAGAMGEAYAGQTSAMLLHANAAAVTALRQLPPMWDVPGPAGLTPLRLIQAILRTRRSGDRGLVVNPQLIPAGSTVRPLASFPARTTGFSSGSQPPSRPGRRPAPSATFPRAGGRGTPRTRRSG